MCIVCVVGFGFLFWSRYLPNMVVIQDFKTFPAEQTWLTSLSVEEFQSHSTVSLSDNSVFDYFASDSVSV